MHPRFPDELPPDHSGHVEVRVEPQDSRWAVWLDVVIPDPDGLPGEVRSRCIAIHPTEKAARIAAHWILRSAKKGRRPPPTELPGDDPPPGD